MSYHYLERKRPFRRVLGFAVNTFTVVSLVSVVVLLLDTFFNNNNLLVDLLLMTWGY